MGALRCRMCSINYPKGEVNGVCPACGEGLSWRPSSTVDPDWKEQVASRLDISTGVTSDVWWRAEQLMRCGLDTVTALTWADAREPWGGFTLDVHEFAAEYALLREKGCSHELACRILNPVIGSEEVRKSDVDSTVTSGVAGC